MKRHLLALICLSAAVGALAASSSSSSSSSLAWRRFKSEHAKVYGPEEDAMRFANFLATKQLVERHNANPNATFKMSLNHMADWTRGEREQLTSSKFTETKRLGRDELPSPMLTKLPAAPVPQEVDWRQSPNRVTPVKDQGNCSAGWAFAATGLLEGLEEFLVRKFVPLSEQELLDCSKTSHGCSGGITVLALNEISDDLKTIESEADYPYEGKTGKCRLDKSKSVMTISGAGPLPYGDEEQLKLGVAWYGPVAVSIFATDNFMHYGSGVLDDSHCSPDRPDVNHSVLVVGYGIDPNGGDYWLVKNSFGEKWGDKGYIKIKRGVNMCGIANYAILAHFEQQLNVAF